MLMRMPIWTWVLPERERAEEVDWREHGGKWIVYGSLSEMERLALELDGYVQSGEVSCAKFWNAGPESALCVYSPDHRREGTRRILAGLGYTPVAWEYDYARRKNWTRPRFFLSAFYKLRILLRSFGPIGALRFIVSAYM